MNTGKLYLVATPIGNLEDITLRALRVLKEVDLIACEDTRHTAGLLSHYGITTPRQSYHEHNEAARTAQLIELLRQGKSVGLVADAGMPLVSDPGYTLVSVCRREGIEVVPIPGASAAITALAASGLPTDSFFFAGFLPPRASARKKALGNLSGISVSLIFYEAPHRIVHSLEDMVAVLGPRQASLARELTKLHEEWLSGTLVDILRRLTERPRVLGEITLVVEGCKQAPAESRHPESLQQHLEEEMAKTGISQKEALKAVARQRGISRRTAYTMLLKERQTGLKG
jgi:16S rRNA (cytidine1402-2'-O)-methyltransferase